MSLAPLIGPPGVLIFCPTPGLHGGMFDVAKSEIHEKFCAAVIRRRKELRITQTELARRLGITQVAVCLTEKGESEPTISRVEAYAKALETTIADLLEVHEPAR